MVALEPKADNNIKAGFPSTGIRPLNPQHVLDKLPLPAQVPNSAVPGTATPEIADCSATSSPKPGTSTSTSSSISQTVDYSSVTPPRELVMESVVVSMLRKMRSGPKTKTSKRANLFVKAGRSISYEEYEQATKQNPANTTKAKSNEKQDRKKRNQLVTLHLAVALMATSQIYHRM